MFERYPSSLLSRSGGREAHLRPTPVCDAAVMSRYRCGIPSAIRYIVTPHHRCDMLAAREIPWLHGADGVCVAVGQARFLLIGHFASTLSVCAQWQWRQLPSARPRWFRCCRCSSSRIKRNDNLIRSERYSVLDGVLAKVLVPIAIHQVRPSPA